VSTPPSHSWHPTFPSGSVLPGVAGGAWSRSGTICFRWKGDDTCLSALDAQIAAESEKLDGLKTHKKALMQLFPAAERG